MMKHRKRLVAAVLSAALTVSLLAGAFVIAQNRWDDTELGALSQYYETGHKTVRDSDPGKIAEVSGDLGGKSYGIYMFASKAGTPYSFAKWLASLSDHAVRRDMGNELVQAYEYNLNGQYSPGYGSNFDHVWRTIAAGNPTEFYNAQKDYWKSQQYDKLVNALSALQIGRYGTALQNVLWSRGVQHGSDGAAKVITRAVGTFVNQSEAQLIEAIYKESGKLSSSGSYTMSGAMAEKYGVSGKSLAYYSGNSGDVQMGVYRRLAVNEPSDALSMLFEHRDNGMLLNEGTYQIKQKSNSDYILGSDTVVSRIVSGEKVSRKMVLTWYQGAQCYTITCGDKRLTATSKGASFSAPSASDNQFWKIAQLKDKSGYVLQNVGTGKYLTIGAKGALAVSSSPAPVWHFTALRDIHTVGLIYPDEDNKLVAGSSSFPIRGIVYCARPLTNVKVQVQVRNGNGTNQFPKSTSGTINTQWYNLWDLDSACSFSTLPAGDYTLKITATVSGSNTPVTVASSNFTVAPAPVEKPPQDDETFTITFDAAGGRVSPATRVYHAGDPYGTLPVPEKGDGNFVGWFLNDEQVVDSTPVAARSHTLIAKYGSLHSAVFKSDNGSVLNVYQLAKGAPISAPTAPIKAADASYSYSFSHWETADGTRYIPDAAFMGDADVTYTAVFTRTALSAPTTPTVPVGYVEGLAPNTTVSALSAAGYSVYSGSTPVTDGNVGTGMTAVAGSNRLTIIVKGDTTGNGKLTITDVVRLQSHVVGKKLLDGAYLKAADINGDGKVSITDVVQAAQYTVGKRTIQ